MKRPSRLQMYDTYKVGKLRVTFFSFKGNHHWVSNSYMVLISYNWRKETWGPFRDAFKCIDESSNQRLINIWSEFWKLGKRILGLGKLIMRFFKFSSKGFSFTSVLSFWDGFMWFFCGIRASVNQIL